MQFHAEQRLRYHTMPRKHRILAQDNSEVLLLHGQLSMQATKRERQKTVGTGAPPLKRLYCLSSSYGQPAAKAPARLIAYVDGYALSSPPILKYRLCM